MLVSHWCETVTKELFDGYSFIGVMAIRIDQTCETRAKIANAGSSQHSQEFALQCMSFSMCVYVAAGDSSYSRAAVIRDT